MWCKCALLSRACCAEIGPLSALFRWTEIEIASRIGDEMHHSWNCAMRIMLYRANNQSVRQKSPFFIVIHQTCFSTAVINCKPTLPKKFADSYPSYRWRPHVWSLSRLQDAKHLMMTGWYGDRSHVNWHITCEKTLFPSSFFQSSSSEVLEDHLIRMYSRSIETRPIIGRESGMSVTVGFNPTGSFALNRTFGRSVIYFDSLSKLPPRRESVQRLTRSASFIRASPRVSEGNERRARRRDQENPYHSKTCIFDPHGKSIAHRDRSIERLIVRLTTDNKRSKRTDETKGRKGEGRVEKREKNDRGRCRREVHLLPSTNLLLSLKKGGFGLR